MISPNQQWNNSQGSVSATELVRLMKKYTELGLKLYVGSDSMLYSEFCIFSCIVAVHSNDLNIANYYFQKQKVHDKTFKSLDKKILKEIEVSIETACFLKSKIPAANIEVHVDIGDRKRNATRHLVDNAKGWVKGMGFDIKIKPNSWASSVADWHTK